MKVFVIWNRIKPILISKMLQLALLWPLYCGIQCPYLENRVFFWVWTMTWLWLPCQNDEIYDTGWSILLIRKSFSWSVVGSPDWPLAEAKLGNKTSVSQEFLSDVEMQQISVHGVGQDDRFKKSIKKRVIHKKPFLKLKVWNRKRPLLRNDFM